MEREQLHKCPRCGNLTTLRLEHEHEIEEDLFDEDNRYATFGYNCYYFFSCSSCNRASIYAYFFTNPVDEKVSELDLIYPVVKDVSYFLPKKVKKNYLEAKKVRNISAVSFAILIRKSLEQICRDKQAKGSNLSQMIRDLSKREILPRKMTELATLIRHLGNASAHDSYPVDFWDVDLLDELFHFITDYIYVIDRSIETIKSKWGINKTAHDKTNQHTGSNL
ncbi:MAG: DUF4145 domain-containing protein [Flavobacteriaceae bacterium]